MPSTFRCLVYISFPLFFIYISFSFPPCFSNFCLPFLLFSSPLIFFCLLCLQLFPHVTFLVSPFHLKSHFLYYVYNSVLSRMLFNPSFLHLHSPFLCPGLYPLLLGMPFLSFVHHLHFPFLFCVLYLLFCLVFLFYIYSFLFCILFSVIPCITCTFNTLLRPFSTQDLCHTVLGRCRRRKDDRSQEDSKRQRRLQ